jgi:hypothetical protein
VRKHGENHAQKQGQSARIFAPLCDLSKSSTVLFADPEQVLPLAKIALKAHALGNQEACDDTPLNLLSGLSGSFAGSPVFPSGLIEVRNKLFIASLSRRVRSAVRKACQHPKNHYVIDPNLSKLT